MIRYSLEAAYKKYKKIYLQIYIKYEMVQLRKMYKTNLRNILSGTCNNDAILICFIAVTTLRLVLRFKTC